LRDANSFLGVFPSIPSEPPSLAAPSRRASDKAERGGRGSIPLVSLSENQEAEVTGLADLKNFI